MVSTTDAHGMADQVARERKNLAEADIDDDDRKAIREFTEHREVNEDLALSTIRSDISTLRRCAERAEKPLLAFENVKDATTLLKANQAEYGVTDASNDNYRKSLRVFFAWADEDADYGGYTWWESIKIPSRDPDPLDPSEVLSVGEVRKLREAADHPREKALVEFLADTGMRIAAALQLLRGDVAGLDGDRPTVSRNREGESQKGMDPLPRPIIQSQRHLRQYLNQFHPEDHPEAPVFATKHYDRREREDAAIHPTTSIGKLKDLAEDAGIDRDRVSNHAFRHVATTRMRRDMRMDWDDIAHRTGWSEQSLARMKQVYEHLTNEDRNDRVWEAVEGESDTDETEPAPPPECMNCGRELEPGDRYCPGCGADQDPTTQTDREYVTHDELEDVIAAAIKVDRDGSAADMDEDDRREIINKISRDAEGNTVAGSDGEEHTPVAAHFADEE